MVALSLAQICKVYSYGLSISHANRHFSGPLISPGARDRVTSLITSALDEGGEIILDGRNFKAPEAYPYGNFVGPTIIKANTSMKCYQYALQTASNFHF